MPVKRIFPPLKTHGGKHYLARKIVALMPRHLHFVEAFFGGGSVLLARDPDDSRLWLSDTSGTRGVSELANDLNGRLMNFWRVLRDEATFARFVRQVEAIPFARTEWEEAHGSSFPEDPVADAVAFFVDARQSRSGLRNGFTPLTRNRTRRKMNGNVSEWLGAVDGLANVHDRLRRVAIENKPALEVIRREDGQATLFYLDPTYCHETRTARKAYQQFEMTDAEHRDLLDTIRQLKGKVMLSGYPSKMYDETLTSWNRHTFDLPNQASGAKRKRRMTEVVWCNY